MEGLGVVLGAIWSLILSIGSDLCVVNPSIWRSCCFGKKIYEIDMHDRMSCMHFYVFKMTPYVSKLILAINKLNWLWDLGYHMLYYYVYVVSAPNISITMKWCSLWNGICTVIAPFYFIIGTRLLKRKYKIK